MSEPQFEWIPYEEIQDATVTFKRKKLIDLYSFCTLNDTCKDIVGSGSEFSYEKLKKSINGMFRVLTLNIEDEQKEQDLNKKEKEIESIIYLINFLLPLLSNNVDPQSPFNIVDEQKFSDIRTIFQDIGVALKTAVDKKVTDIQELPDNESTEYYVVLLKVLDVEPYNTVQTHIDKIAIANYYIGKITFNECKDYARSVKHIEKAITLNQDCKGFEKVYELLADIIIHAHGNVNTKERDLTPITKMCDTLGKPELKKKIMEKIFEQFDARFTKCVYYLSKFVE